MKVIMKSVCVK